MEITRTRSLTIRMGEYESFVTSATVVAEAPADDDGTATIDRLNSLLDYAMAEDIADAQELTGDRKSFIHRIPTPKD